MRTFKERLEAELRRAESDGGEELRWVYVPYDQLTADAGPLAEASPGEVGIVLVESRAKAERRPYHVQKLALILANQRHFAIEQARRGVRVRYEASDRPYAEVLESVVDDVGPLALMEPAERELRAEIETLVATEKLELIPNRTWLTNEAQFEAARDREGRWRMDAFYRRVRADLDILMEDGSPVGGRWSFDAENRDPWPGEPPAPEAPSFEPDDVTREVGELIEAEFADHPGRLDLSALPATAEDAAALWSWARAEALPHFGPFEDAMSVRSRGLFHTRISPLLNIGRLLPCRIVEDALDLDLPLATMEGFVRQVVGWREFMRHLHRETDGFRQLADMPALEVPEDAGYATWKGTPADWGSSSAAAIDGGVDPAGIEDEPISLPSAWWGDPSGLTCLDTVVESVWEEGWSHHITRLMVLGNIASLLGVRPRELTDWFWVAYIDAFDWVVEPNVLGMASFALGDLMTTKPYISGANYIRKMSDYCESCAFDPKDDCPLIALYWAYLARNRPSLESLPRMRLPLASLERRSDDRREADARTFEWARSTLAEGERLTPDDARRVAAGD